MITIVRTGGRVLWMHWPVMLAWFLGGSLGSYVAIELAGWVGAYTAIGGSLLLPLAVLTRLVAYVAMFLVLRDGMRELNALAPISPAGPERRKAFADALLISILPFFAFYAAWGFLRDDAAAYYERVLEVSLNLDIQQAFGGGDVIGDGAAGELTVGPVTVAIIVIAFALRWLFKRYRARLPKATVAAAVYLEVLWVFYSIYVLSQMLGWVTGWIANRQGMVWLGDFRETVTSAFAPLAFVWEGIEWLLGEAGGIMLLPLAWLTIAGVIYGRAVSAVAPVLQHEKVDTARARFEKLPQRLRARLRDVWNDLIGRFKPIWSALVLMLRSGPVLIGSYVLLYTVLLLGERLWAMAVTRLVGPHEIFSFWLVADQMVLFAIPLVVEPIRIALVAGAYDSVIGKLAARTTEEPAPATT